MPTKPTRPSSPSNSAQKNNTKAAAPKIAARASDGSPAKPSKTGKRATGACKEDKTTRAIKNVCVYCGSGHGTNPIYAEAARTLGQSLAESKIGLVYGGGGLGLMGEVARATLKGGGRVTGIIPEFLTRKEHMLRDVNELMITKDMHERKREMFERSDAFVALPGGIGTLEELVEQLTWSQLGQHAKPIVVANIAGFWNPFLKLLAHMRDDQFIRNGINVHFIVVDDAKAIVPAILATTKAMTQEVSDAAITAKF